MIVKYCTLKGTRNLHYCGEGRKSLSKGMKRYTPAEILMNRAHLQADIPAPVKHPVVKTMHCTAYQGKYLQQDPVYFSNITRWPCFCNPLKSGYGPLSSAEESTSWEAAAGAAIAMAQQESPLLKNNYHGEKEKKKNRKKVRFFKYRSHHLRTLAKTEARWEWIYWRMSLLPSSFTSILTWRCLHFIQPVSLSEQLTKAFLCTFKIWRVHDCPTNMV